jgi:Family of unknown function (DUF6511)
MANPIQRFATEEPTACAVCRRRAVWLGYAPLREWMAPKGPVVWLCDDKHCHRAVRSIYTMPAPNLDAYEEAAALEAGVEAAGYLEECGTTDLAKLKDDEWREFLRRVLTGFEQSLRRKILNGEAPF